MPARCCGCKGTQLRPERQFGQVGVELIGAAAADRRRRGRCCWPPRRCAAVGVADLSVDLTRADPGAGGLPTRSASPASATARLRRALDRKDAAEVAALGGEAAPAARGAAARPPARRAGAGRAGRRSTCRRAAAAERAAAGRGRRADRAPRAPTLTLTVDPVEHRGFEYHTGVSFTLFAARRPRRARARRALPGGRAPGRQRAGDRLHALPRHGPARAARRRRRARRVLVPVDTPTRDGARAARRRLGHGRGAGAPTITAAEARGCTRARWRLCRWRRQKSCPARLGDGLSDWLGGANASGCGKLGLELRRAQKVLRPLR